MSIEGVDMSARDIRTAVRTYGHHIGGKRVDGTGTIDRFNPATGQLTATFADGDARAVEQAVRAARVNFDAGTWRWLPGAERGRLLANVATRIRDNAERFAQIEVAETGKTIRTARQDIAGAVGHFENAASLAWQIKGDSYNALGPELSAVNVREPVGVVGLIVPWNFPALILAQKLPYALAAGCSVVVKPAETTSGTACEIVALCEEVGIPAGVVNLVTGYGASAGQALTQHGDVDFVSFTGSTATGRQVVAASAGNLKRIALELGGKAATIVFADADLEDAIDAALFAITFNQGECCVSGTRLIIEDRIADDFLVELVRRAQQLQVGDPSDESTDIGALIHEQHLEQVLRLVRQGIEDGARLLCGGSRLCDGDRQSGHFVGPTVLDDVEPTNRVFQQEIFGPVLSVTRFSTAAEAVDLANDSIYGLANSVWSKNVDTVQFVSHRLRSGTVWVNTVIDGAPQLPLGGYKQSGYGREAGALGLEEFTNVKSIQTRIGRRTPAYPNVS